MAYFDFLIDKENKPPQVGMEYIYRHDIIWKVGDHNPYDIKPGTIMKNVVQLDSGGYEFFCKETGEKFKSNYSWSLAEDTPENVVRIEKYEKEYKKFKEYEKLVDGLRVNNR